MAATKRKRRGGLAVQAKKLKRDAKDGKLPAKPNDVSEEAADEEKDRIPGPVCKVKGAFGRGSTLFRCGTSLITALRVSEVQGVSWELRLSSPGGTLCRVCI